MRGRRFVGGRIGAILIGLLGIEALSLAVLLGPSCLLWVFNAPQKFT